MSRRDEAKRNNRARQLARDRAAAKSEPSHVRLSRLRVQEMADATCAEAKWIAAGVLAGVQGKDARQGDFASTGDSGGLGVDRHNAAAGRESAADIVVRAADETRMLALKVIGRSPYHGKHECRAGCAFCCHTAVTIAPPEAVAMMRQLREELSANELANIRQRIEDNATTASATTRAQYVSANVRCAMLTDDGNCRVHASRPLACAGFLSLSRAACEAEFNRVLGRGEVPIDRFATTAGMSASYGLKAACEEAGVDGDYYELHHALRAIWDRTDAAEAWARGERLFEGCVRSVGW